MARELLTMDLVYQEIDEARSYNDVVFCSRVSRQFSRGITTLPVEVRLDLWRFLRLYWLKENCHPANEDVAIAVEMKLDAIAVSSLQEKGYTVSVLLGVELGWDAMAARFWASS